LKQLHLFRNKLETIPPEVGNLVNCKRMSFSGNNLTVDSLQTIHQCEGLEELYLSGNAKLKSVPESFGKLRMLQELSIRNCKGLKSVPASLADCELLREVDVRPAGKKPICVMPPEVMAALEEQKCVIRGAKKGKKKKGKK
jgi:Leucine-rich repeat (LRR) protein